MFHTCLKYCTVDKHEKSKHSYCWQCHYVLFSVFPWLCVICWHTCTRIVWAFISIMKLIFTMHHYSFFQSLWLLSWVFSTVCVFFSRSDLFLIYVPPHMDCSYSVSALFGCQLFDGHKNYHFIWNTWNMVPYPSTSLSLLRNQRCINDLVYSIVFLKD